MNAMGHVQRVAHSSFPIRADLCATTSPNAYNKPMVYVVIEGVIGVGKTALTRLLGEQFGMHTFFEKFEENPFLNDLS